VNEAAAHRLPRVGAVEPVGVESRRDPELWLGGELAQERPVQALNSLDYKVSWATQAPRLADD
jgi:hypothetical protein